MMNKINKVVGRLALAGALVLGAGTMGVMAANQPVTVQAKAHHKKHHVIAGLRRYRTASTKDYKHLAVLASKPGMHYLKRPIYAFAFTPCTELHDGYRYPSGKLIDAPSQAGTYTKVIAAGTLKGNPVVLTHDNNSPKIAAPIREFMVPEGMKLKAGAHPVYAYDGRLKNSEAGYDNYYGQFETDHNDDPDFVKQGNTIYTNHKSTTHRVTMKHYGEYGGFVIGKYTIKMNDGKNYYPIFYHSTSWIDYIPEEDIDQFEPTKVETEDYTLNGSKITPRKKSFCAYDFAG